LIIPQRLQHQEEFNRNRREQLFLQRQQQAVPFPFDQVEFDQFLQQAQAQQQQMAQIEEQKIAAQQQMHAEDMQLKQYISDSTNQTKIQVAEIGVFSRQQDLDLDMSGVPDPIELADQALRQREVMSKEFMENLKLQTQKMKDNREASVKQKELSLKEKELLSKEKIEAEKNKIARENMKNDLAVARENAKGRKKDSK
jgi:hypothetical protein